MPEKIINLKYNDIDLSISAEYREGGENLLFFIHGLGCAKESFAGALNSKPLKKNSLLAFDLPGHGGSSRPSSFSYSMQDYVNICEKILIPCLEKRIHIIAHSMGGAIGLLLARKIENYLSSFISVEGNLIGSDCSISRKTVLYSSEDFQKKFLNELIISSKASDEKGVRLWADWVSQSFPEGFYRSAASLVKWSDSGELLKIFLDLKCPRVYFYGQQNSKIEVLERLGDIEKVCIHKSGHFPMNDNPAEFYAKLSEIMHGIKS